MTVALLRPRVDRARSRPGWSRRIVSAGASVGLAVLLTSIDTPAAQAASPSPTPANRRVTVTVADMTPTTPLFSTSETTLTIKLTLTNNSDVSLHKVSVTGYRDAPYDKLDQLQAALASPPLPSRRAGMMRSMTVPDLEAHATAVIVYTATASQLETSDMCLCANGIYPLDFSVSAATSANGSAVAVGIGQTYLPSFIQPVQNAASPFSINAVSPVAVTWIWPLIDRPHRIVGGSEFIDDDLATSISNGGRLDRALQVLEQLPAEFHLTVMVDPELIDELLVMAGGYTVITGGTPAAGTHAPQAISWLSRFRAMAAIHEIRFTASGDPDPEALTSLGTKIIAGVTAQVASQVADSQASSTQLRQLAWPLQGSTGSAGVQKLVDAGATTLLLSDGMFASGVGPHASSKASSIVPIQLDNKLDKTKPLTALVTDSSTQGLAADVVGGRLDELPQLVSSVAIRAVVQPSEHHDLTIAAPRYVDPSVGAAVRALRETALTTWSTPLSTSEATSKPTAQPTAKLRYPDHVSATIPATAVTVAGKTADSAHALATSFVDPADATKVVGDYNATTQWAVSNAWAHDGAVRSFDARLVSRAASLEGAIQIVRPANGSYTLASSSAPLLVSVVNTLPYPVRVSVKLSPVGSVQGLTTDDIGPQEIQGNGGQVSLRIPAHAQRTGRFDVVATLRTADGTPLGQPVRLSVRSTVLGPVGLIIMVIAGVVLVVALAGRLIRRIRRGPSPREVATVAATREIVAADEAAVEAADDETAQEAEPKTAQAGTWRPPA